MPREQHYEDMLWEEAMEKMKDDRYGKTAKQEALAKEIGYSARQLARWHEEGNPSRSKKVKNLLSIFLGYTDFEDYKEVVDNKEASKPDSENNIINLKEASHYAFPQDVTDALCNRVISFCSHPSHHQPTIAPDLSDDSSVVNTGIACYITSPYNGAPRYDANFPEADFLKISNGIWLCPTHAATANAGKNGGYTAIELKQWKANREQFARDFWDDKIKITLTIEPQTPAAADRFRNNFNDNAIESTGFSGSTLFMLIINDLDQLLRACAFYQKEKTSLKDARIRIGREEILLENFIGKE